MRDNTELVHLVLDRLALAGATWAPRFIGVEDAQEVLSWLPGTAVDDWRDNPARLDELAVIIRELHDVTIGMIPGVECVVHDDLQPRNIVIATDGRLGVIDWEQTRGGWRVDDVAQLCWSFVGPTGDGAVGDVARRWRRVLDAYGLHDHGGVVAAALSKLERCIADMTRSAAAGSLRHQVLLDRGDHHELAAMHRWLSMHGARLSAAIG